MQKIVTNLWFDGHVEEAIAFYTSVFENSHVKTITRYGKTGRGPIGEIMTADIEIEGQLITIINGGPAFKQSPAASLLINCEDQAEVDLYWEKLSEGGAKSQCGWVTDPFGVSWQVTPVKLLEMITDEDTEKSDRVISAMLTMQKLDIAALERAYNGD